MHLRDSDSEAVFRAEARRWLEHAVRQLPPEPPALDLVARRTHHERWQHLLTEAGYAGINWPADFGGRGATPTEHLIFLEESARAGAPNIGVGFVGQMHAGPTLIAEGTREQQERHLGPILRGQQVWCQGFSEPDAGSDLAALRTRAVRDGDDYVVTGQKIWTSYAPVADFCELLVRTDPDAPKHRGVSWLILPMDSAGIDVRPLVTIQGDTEFAELFLDEVRVPVANRVGAENDGWRVANVTLRFERGTGFVAETLDTIERLHTLVALARSTPCGTETVWDDDSIRRDIAEIAAELDGLWAFTKRNVSEGAKGQPPISGGPALKLTLGRVMHHLGDVAAEVLGRTGLSLDDVAGAPTGELVRARLWAFAVSTGGGTTQIQQNILAERVLGLPREA